MRHGPERVVHSGRGDSPGAEKIWPEKKREREEREGEGEGEREKDMRENISSTVTFTYINMKYTKSLCHL